MGWIAYFTVFVVAHLVGDFALQTDFQAVHKHFGLGRDPVARRALFSHLATYSLPIVGACVWIASVRPAAWTVVVGAIVLVEHLIQDDGRLLIAYCRRVKHFEADEQPGIFVWVDQTFHVLALFGAALLLTV